MIGGGVAQRVEEPPAAVGVTPALGVHARDVVAQVQEVGPLLRLDGGGCARPGDVRLAAVGELELGALAAVRTVDEQHGALVRDRGGGGLVDQVAVAEALEGERRVDRVRLVVGDASRRTRAPSPASP